ncbi:MAG: M20/M25/M40 family metallo-hydrolase [Gemmatimonadales bacterium]
METLKAVLPLMLVAAASPPAISGQELSTVERQIAEYVDAHNEEAVGLLERVVNINSGTMNHEGVRAVGRVFRSEFDELGFSTRWMPLDNIDRAGHLFAEIRGDRGRKLLLIGHLDTVFPEDSPFQRFERDGTMARGPGTEDMKAGDVIILYALKALRAAGALDGATIVVALTGDEEDTGEPLDATRRYLIDAAKRSDVALGFEGGVGGMHTATVARRGYTGWSLRVSGKRGHSSLIFGAQYGSGAIYETARILNSFREELAGEEYLTFGPGIIVGGTAASYDTAHARGTAFGKTNVIPQTVTVAGDLRTLTVEQRDRTKAKMQEIVARHLPLTSAEITFRDSYPPMAPTAGNRDLLAMLDRVNRDMGYGPIETVDPGRRGAADISFATAYVDGLAGLGAFGSGGHTPEEMVDLRSVPVATKRAAILIYRLTRGGVGSR